MSVSLSPFEWRGEQNTFQSKEVEIIVRSDQALPNLPQTCRSSLTFMQ